MGAGCKTAGYPERHLRPARLNKNDRWQTSLVSTVRGLQVEYAECRKEYNEGHTTVFYLYSACFMNAFNLNMCSPMSYAG